jgi:hypothetical protein
MADQFTDKTVNVDQLEVQIAALGLTGYKGIARSHGANIEVRADTLNDSDKARVQAVIDAHTPAVVKTVATLRGEAIDAITTVANVKAFLREWLR